MKKKKKKKKNFLIYMLERDKSLLITTKFTRLISNNTPFVRHFGNYSLSFIRSHASSDFYIGPRIILPAGCVNPTIPGPPY
jgi:hypothetical protein